MARHTLVWTLIFAFGILEFFLDVTWPRLNYFPVGFVENSKFLEFLQNSI